MSMTPQYRIEEYLAAIRAAWLGESPLPSYPDEPAWRIEKFLAAILSSIKGDSPVVACPDPVWHIEEFARAIYDALTGASPAWPCPTATNNIEAILHAIYKVVADGTETDGIATSWDIERWLLDSYEAAKEGGGTEKTASGTLVHITDALAKAALSVLVSIAPIQPGSGDPAPDNARPISGLTGLSVYVSPTSDVADATTYSVDWTTEAGTVYGGTLDVVTGVLTVDRAMVDLGTLNWTYVSSDTVFYTSIANKKDGLASLMCSRYRTVGNSGYTVPDYAIGTSGNSALLKRVFVSDPNYNTAADFKTAMSGVQLCYELATPITYQLTPQEVQMLLGENYLWSSSGDSLSVTYVAEGNANNRQALNILLGDRYSNPGTPDDVSDKEALDIILGR